MASKPSKRRRRRLIWPAYIGAFLLTGVAVASVWEPIAFPPDTLPAQLRGTTATADASFAANKRGTGAYGIKYATNGLGLRGAEPDLRKPQVVILGDSTSFGLKVPLNDSYAARLRARLAAAGDDTGVLNAALPGHGAINHVAQLRRLIEKEKVDVAAVVIGFYGNDFANDFHTTHRAGRHGLDETLVRFPLGRNLLRARQVLRGEGAPAAPGPRRVSTATGMKLDARGEYSPEPGRELQADEVAPDAVRANRSYQASIGATRELLRYAGALDIPVHFMYMPSEVDEVARPPRWLGVMTADVKAGGGAIVDLIGHYRSVLGEDINRPLPELISERPALFTPPGDFSHPGPEASDRIAHLLFEAIRREP